MMSGFSFLALLTRIINMYGKYTCDQISVLYLFTRSSLKFSNIYENSIFGIKVSIILRLGSLKVQCIITNIFIVKMNQLSLNSPYSLLHTKPACLFKSLIFPLVQQTNMLLNGSHCPLNTNLSPLIFYIFS